MADNLIWGIDLGGTKIECAVLEREGFKVLCRERIPTERDKGYQHILQQLQRLVETVSAKVGVAPLSIGIGLPGIPDQVTGKLKNGNTLCLNGKPFRDDFAALVGVPITIGNDANCFALAETHMGIVLEECPQAEIVFGVVLGTGAGGGIVVNGKGLIGHHGIAGEWGHVFLDESGGQCYCGNKGCVESIISGTALEKYYAKLSGQHLSLKEIVANKEVDSNAKKTIERLVAMFAKGIVQVINILDPDVIVVGGGVSHIDALFEDALAEINQYIYNDSFDGKLLRPLLGDSAGVFGAAMLLL